MRVKADALTLFPLAEKVIGLSVCLFVLAELFLIQNERQKFVKTIILKHGMKFFNPV